MVKIQHLGAIVIITNLWVVGVIWWWGRFLLPLYHDRYRDVRQATTMKERDCRYKLWDLYTVLKEAIDEKKPKSICESGGKK